MINKLLYSIRPSACLGVALFAAASFQDASDIMSITAIFLAVFSGAAGCFLINDLNDIEKDLLNDKKRPIATGELPREFAISSIFTFLLFYVVASIYLGIETIIISILTIGIFLSYSKANKRFGLMANVMVATCVGLAFVYGGILNELDRVLVYLIASAFFVTIGREIMLDALDKSGDAATNKSSIPLSMSMKNTTIVILSIYLVGTIPVTFLIGQNALYTIFSITMIAVLWIPLMVRFFFPKMDWILFNIRSSHAYFGLMIALLFLR